MKPRVTVQNVKPRVTMRDRKWAVTWLADRGCGRPAIQLLALADPPDAPSDLTPRRVLRACSNEELDMRPLTALRSFMVAGVD